MADKYEVVTNVPGYYTSLDAKNGTDRRNTVHPAKYYVFNKANGMINVTSQQGSPGSWINPKDNVKPKEPVLEKEANDSKKSTVSKNQTSNPNYATSTTPKLSSDGSNKKVYKAVKDYIPCYVINLLTGGKIEFDCEPDEITDTNSNQFDPQDIRGRSSPYQGYNNSGPRSISFNVILHDDLCKEGVLNTVNHLRSLTYPNYGGVLIPPKCLVRIGDMIHCKAVINDVSVVWQKPYRNGVYLVADVTINATEVVDTPFSANEIWSKGGYI